MSQPRLYLALAVLGAGAQLARPASAAPGPPAAAEDLAARLGRIEGVLAEQREKLHIAGLSVVVVKDDRIVLLKGLGLRDLDQRLPVTGDTRFPIGSCTKAFTAMAVALAQDEGRLSFDDSPRRLLPGFHMADPEANELVTLRDMLSHRSGLRGHADLAAEPGVLSRAEYVRAATSAKPAARFREKFQYSNAMYAAAGEVLGQAYRSTWEDVITTRILRPLGMSSSLAAAKDLGPIADHATGYAYSEEKKTWQKKSVPASLQALAPAGSIVSTARDMAQWLRLMAGDGTVDGKRLVSAEGLREVTTPHLPATPSFSYCLGWATYQWNGHKVVEHNGGSAGISALMSVLPEKKLGFALLANSSPTSLTKIGNAGKLLWPLLTGETEAAPRPPAPAPKAAEAARAPGPAAPGLTLDELLGRMVAAAGGERSLRRHTVMEVRGRKRYENQGVEADVRTLRKAPDLLSEEETWTAAGRRIGSVRTYFDGARGGQETSFGQDDTYAGEELDKARRDATRGTLRELRGRYARMTVGKEAPAGDEPVIAIEAIGAGGGRDVYHVSARTYLLVGREREGEKLVYSDFRSIDGEVVPFRVVTRSAALGEVTTTVTSVRFNSGAPVPEAFGPRTHAPKGAGRGRP